jgi:hypothetical protein
MWINSFVIAMGLMFVLPGRIVQIAALLVQKWSIRGAQSKRGVGAGPVAAMIEYHLFSTGHLRRIRK